MTRQIHISYLFDPLCGWCYGATPAMRRLSEMNNVTVELAPTGLFSDAGARTMDSHFADYAWSNDQRIQQLTGQRFSESYRDEVLTDHRTMFDSGPATLALTAVSLSTPERELDALKAIQEARYIAGRDITALPILAEILAGLDLVAASACIAVPDEELLRVNQARKAHARKLMQDFGANGVPALIVTDGGKSRLLRGDLLYGNLEKLAAIFTGDEA